MKNSKPTKKITPPTKTKKRWTGEYYDPEHKVYRPYTEDQIKEELKEFGRNPKNLYTERFWADRHMSSRVFSDLLKRVDGLREIYEDVKTLIGTRRDEGAITRKLDGAHVSRTLGHYWPVFKEMEEWRAKLRLESEKNAPNIEIIMPELKEEK